jgi:GDP-L-fucose synthase
VYDKSKPNGTMRKLIDSSKIFNLNWKPKISLKSGIKLIVKELI